MKLLDLIIDTIEDKKGNDVSVIDFKNTSPLCDAFVICDAQSQRQVKAIADAVERAVIDHGFEIKNPGRAGDETWIIIDAVDVVVHIFTREERQRYDLDRLYKEYVSERVL